MNAAARLVRSARRHHPAVPRPSLANSDTVDRVYAHWAPLPLHAWYGSAISCMWSALCVANMDSRKWSSWHIISRPLQGSAPTNGQCKGKECHTPMEVQVGCSSPFLRVTTLFQQWFSVTFPQRKNEFPWPIDTAYFFEINDTRFMNAYQNKNIFPVARQSVSK